MARESIGHLPSYAKTKKMKLLTLHIHGYPMVSLRDWALFFSSFASYEWNIEILQLYNQNTSSITKYSVFVR